MTYVLLDSCVVYCSCWITADMMLLITIQYNTMIKLDWCVINFGGLQEKISAFAVLGNGGYTVTYMDLTLNTWQKNN